ncbi:glycosyltransferase [Solirubrobacter sp. CPCC 204708]|uniref:PHP domain-containing protein n=1 Tax=Solirubrobacter deserti TaxID=2282478 RepID=A0ABT4RKB5_9ACTN|nr:PHP domain-containing protein [Solirubrobacter deserti]MBE2316795.1 glycosyltransferase [Solirubrobacter deserti]MDA0138990.1 PHP domain-containing protein [Solirubrobacter deserti]
MAERFAIAQVAPHPLEDANEVGTFASEVSKELAARGHRVLLLAPSRNPDLVRESRRLIRAARETPEDLFDPDGGVRVLGVGELLFNTGRKGINPAPPVDIARTIEEVLTHTPLDFVHVHEPWAPSAGSVALRHSRALNVGSFHAPAERVLSTQVARKFVELFFGRMDARTASYEATAELMNRFFPSSYQLLRPGMTPEQRERPEGPPRIAFSDREERGALRLFLRALRLLPEELPWEAVVYSKTGGIPTLRSSLRNRVTVVDDEDAAFASADIVVAASLGQVTAPGVLVKALGVGAVPLAARTPVYEEVLREGDLGLHFQVGDVEVLAQQLERALKDEALRAKLVAAGAEAREALGWTRVTDQVEEIYAGLAALRHDPDPKPEVRARVAKKKLIDVDLHMHTDHSNDCATPVDVLLATAVEVGLGAIAVTDHNEISGAHDAAAKAADYGIKVIVGEEVKTADQGEVIGLFINEKIPRGMTLEETIAEIRRQGGLVYVPHPFDRLHSVPDYEHMLAIVSDIDAIEVFNPRIAIPAFNEEAVRFAAKYRIVGGAGTDGHVAQALGSVRITMRDFDGPEEFLESLRDANIAAKPSSLRYAQVQALKFLQTTAMPPAARRATRRRKVAKAVAGRGGQ